VNAPGPEPGLYPGAGSGSFTGPRPTRGESKDLAPRETPTLTPTSYLARRASGQAHSPPVRALTTTCALGIALLTMPCAYASPSGAAARAPAAGAPAPTPPARGTSPLSQLLAQTFRSYGGVDAILAVEGVRLRGSISDRTTDPRNPPRLERLLALPDRYRATVTLNGQENEVLVLDGPRAFRDGAEVTGLARADQIRLEAARVFLPGALARGRDTLVDRGEAQREGRRVRRVELPLHRNASITAEIEASSGMIIRAVTRVSGREYAVSFRSFRPIDGILFPFAEDLELREGKRTVTLEKVELLKAGEVGGGRP
jgi:hypothetical protein